LRPLISISLVFFALASFFGRQEDAQIRIRHLACEYLSDPEGIDATEPKLSWQLKSDQRGQKQTAYRLLVASSQEKLAKDDGDLWDSGKVESDQ
jgi:alpha-L-rhamnosidase